ncbi:hypothetical protein FI667_g14067, partial [Globisporangium splendens]
MIKKVILSFLLAAVATNIEVDAQTASETICNQVACWVSTKSESCVRNAAERTQVKVMKGRDAYKIESIGSSGGWVRYWRVPNPRMGRGKIDWGTCADDNSYVVENCQIGGSVKC